MHAAYGKLVFDCSTDRYNCITEHEGFEAVVKKEVLLLAGPLLKTNNGKAYRRRAGVSENEYIKYRSSLLLFCKKLAFFNTKVLCFYFLRSMHYQCSP